jgi:glutamate formiminotransferase / 5-formyltetrahydrofolate cyclo-ligase
MEYFGPMRGMLEAVPNFSEGRDGATLRAIREALESTVRVLDVHADPDHHRSVFTCVGGADALVDGLAAGVAAAIERIDLARHHGVHPRVGAADVVPIVRFEHGDPRPAAVAAALGERIGALGVPVIGYAELGGGHRPAHYRSGGPDGLRARLERGEVVPSWGPARPHPTAGVVLLGVRPPLVAFNVNLDTDRVEVAAGIARAVRASGGGLPGVQALGMRAGGRAQVSMNLIDLAATPLHTVVAEVERLAAELGAAVLDAELVGLIPASVAAAAGAAALRLPAMAPERILEVAVRGQFGRASG